MLLGFVIALQYKHYQRNYSNDPTYYESVTEELITLRREKEKLVQEVEELEARLDAVSGSASQESVLVKNLTDDLQKVKALLGLTKLSGPGIVITLDNPATEGGSAFQGRTLANDYLLILALVNELYASGAEAICINEQRLINYSEVRLVGQQLNVNYVPLNPPYVLKAIGNYDTLESSVTQRFGIIGHIREAGYYAEVRKAETLEVPAYAGVLKFDYAEVLK